MFVFLCQLQQYQCSYGAGHTDFVLNTWAHDLLDKLKTLTTLDANSSFRQSKMHEKNVNQIAFVALSALTIQDIFFRQEHFRKV